MEPSKEKKAEALERRKVKALEAIAEHLETLAGAVAPAGKAKRDYTGFGAEEFDHAAYIRTNAIESMNYRNAAAGSKPPWAK